MLITVIKSTASGMIIAEGFERAHAHLDRQTAMMTEPRTDERSGTSTSAIVHVTCSHLVGIIKNLGDVAALGLLAEAHHAFSRHHLAQAATSMGQGSGMD
jgi:hypothetical protein